MTDLGVTNTVTADSGQARPPLIRGRRLVFGYDGRPLTTGLDLTVARGGALRVDGRNGTGKSTLMRVLAGVHPLISGNVIIEGHDLDLEPVAARAVTGYSDGRCPFPYLTGREHLRLTSRIYGIPAHDLADTISTFGAWPVAASLDRQIRTYSRGMEQQLALIAELLHRPAVLLLDEALDGFDRETLADATQELRVRVAAGMALVFVGHRVDGFADFPKHDVLTLTSDSVPFTGAPGKA